MKIFFTIVFILLFSILTYSQDISLPRPVAEKALTAMELVPVLENKIKILEDQVSLLKSQQTTPCSLAIKSVNESIIRLETINTDNMSDKDRKVAVKLRKKNHKFVVKEGKKLLQSQCGYKDSNKWGEVLKQLVPLGFLLFKL